MSQRDRTIRVIRLGRTRYRSCWELQRRLLELRSSGAIGDVLLLTEHDHVYTIGKTGSDDHLLAGESEREILGVELVHTDRGGDITYHGPGQIVGYPILDLNNYGRDLHRYLRDLEEVTIRVLAGFGVSGTRIPGYTGVWADGEKICAIGVRSVRWVTMHGFALNVCSDLSYFGRIIPCGIFEKGVTSLEAITGRRVEPDEVTPMLVEQFGYVFGAAMTFGTLKDLPASEPAVALHETY